MGHQTGDEALKFLARRVGELLRPGDVVARYGGEEFVVILPETSVDDGQQILTRLQRTMSAEFFTHEDKKVFITSAGSRHTVPTNRLKARWNGRTLPLYEAKRTGKTELAQPDQRQPCNCCSTAGSCCGQVVRDQPRSKQARRFTMRPRLRAGCFPKRHALCQQTGDHAGQHIARPGGTKPRRRIAVDRRSPIGRGHHGIGPFEQDHSTAVPRPNVREPTCLVPSLGRSA